jgi:hypothetical protein
MGPNLVVVAAPGFDHDFGLGAGENPFQTETSPTPFCHGLPGSIRAVSMPWSTIHLSSARATNSGPLSDRR